MADPITIIGGIDACQSLAGILYKIVEASIHMGDDVKALYWRYKDDRLVLEKYLDFFKANEKDLAKENMRHFGAITSGLRDQLTSFKDKVTKYQNKTIVQRVIWFKVREDVIGAELELREWVERMGTHFLQLPVELRERMAIRVTSSEYLKNHSAFSKLLAIDRLRERKNEAESASESILSDLKADEPVHGADDSAGVLWRPHEKMTIAVPQQVLDNPDLKYQMELEVARLVFMLGASNLAEIGTKALHIPRAVSYFERPAPADEITKFGIVYEMPTSAEEIYTLKEFIENDPPAVHSNHAIDERVRLAHEIATAVAVVHSIDWVHKGVRTANILQVYRPGDTKKPRGLGQVYLTGFQHARRSDKNYISTGGDSAEWYTQIYRHPERQEDHPSAFVYFKPYHDLYSLGVVLLELGLWRGFDNSKDKKALQYASPNVRKQFMLHLMGDLDKTVGTTYQRVVKKCLNIDEDSPVDIHEVLGDLETIKLGR